MSSEVIVSKRKRRLERISLEMKIMSHHMAGIIKAQAEREMNNFWCIFNGKHLQLMRLKDILKIIQRVMISDQKRVDRWEQSLSPIKCIPFTMPKENSITTIMRRVISQIDSTNC
jgi:hypothetical protein